MMLTGRLVIHFRRDMSWKPDFAIIRQLFRFGLPAGIQGVAMNVAGVLLLRFIGSLEHSAEAQAAYAVAYSELFSLITWTSVGLMGAAAAVAGQNLGAGNPDRVGPRGAPRRADRPRRRGLRWPRCSCRSRARCSGSSPSTIRSCVELGTQLLRYLSVSAFFITVALTFTGGLQGTGDTRSPLYITLVSQVAVPMGLVLRPAGDGPPGRVRGLDRDRPRARHPVRAVHLAVSTGEVEDHPGVVGSEVRRSIPISGAALSVAVPLTRIGAPLAITGRRDLTMRWTAGNRSNIEDMRGRSGGGMAMGAGGLGVGGLLLLLVLSWATGIDLTSIVGGGGSAPPESVGHLRRGQGLA